MRSKIFEILIVDDDISHAKLTQKILENVGFHVTHALNLAEANKVIEEHPPHLILLDLKLEKEISIKLLLDHGEFFKKFGIRVVMFSQVGDKEVISKSLALGADDYIIKPLNSKLLLQKVNKNLEGNEFAIRLTENEMKFKGYFNGEIKKFNEFEIVINSSIRLKEKFEVNFTSVNIVGPNFKNFKVISKGNSTYQGKSSYDNYTYIAGANEETLQEFRKLQKVKGQR